MTQNVYNKANSIIDFTSSLTSRADVFANLLELEAMAKTGQDSLLTRILADLLSPHIENNENSQHFFLRDHVLEEMARLNFDDYERYLKYRYAYEIFPIQHEVAKFPPVVQIEPASVCNYRCVFCYQTDPRLSEKKNGHMGLMKLDTFKSIIDQIEGNVEGVTLASRGEPSVNKRLPEMLQYMSGKFLAAKINTNAYLLDEKLAHAILDADLQTLVFSADAAAEPLYSKLRVNGNLDRVVRNVESFHEIKEKYYPHSKLITRVSGVRFSSDQNMEEMEQFWHSYVDQVAFVEYNPWENVYDAGLKGIDTPCSDLWRRLFVWWDGKVAPCDVDYLTTLFDETIHTSSVSEIWNGRSYQELRASHLSGQRQKKEPCARCVVV